MRRARLRPGAALVVLLLAACSSAQTAKPANESPNGAFKPGWNPAAPMSVPRFMHIAAPLGSGRVLVSGGCGRTFAESARELHGKAGKAGAEGLKSLDLPTNEVCLDPASSAQIYEAGPNRWVDVPPMAIARSAHLAEVIAEGPKSVCGSRCGRVLVIGGDLSTSTEGPEQTAELFDPETKTWSPAAIPPQTGPRLAVSIPVKGANCGSRCGSIALFARQSHQSLTYFYDPRQDRWTQGASPPVALADSGFSLTALPGGEIVLLGGQASTPKPSVGAIGGRAFPADPAIYNPANDSWRVLPATGIYRSGHTATLLPGGEVLVAGGTQPATNLVTASSEIFKSSGRGEFSLKPVRSMTAARTFHRALPLSGGRVLITGGGPANPADGPLSKLTPPGTEIFDSKRRTWQKAPLAADFRGSLRKLPLPAFTATALSPGAYLVAGGIEADGRALSSAEVFIDSL